MATPSTKQAVNTSLYASKSPLEWAITHNGTLYTAQIPIDEMVKWSQMVSKRKLGKR